ncbi:protein translocase subunit SecF [Streptomyces sp. B5E4]|uniref:protein translocase subunit SecF n=1 Tax=Streptomyces sp. B5E4 TaxID=3153568 RepID=UPI00325E6958
MSRLGTLGARLYRGEAGYDFVAKRFLWYGVSVLITIIAIAGFFIRGLNMGIEFEGGAVFTTPKTETSVSQAQEVAEDASGHQAIVQELGSGKLRIQVSSIETQQSDKVKTALAEELNVDAQDINDQLVGPSWGEQIANKAWQGLAIFMVLVVIYLAIAFEWRMALSALVALIHDLTITVGVYTIVGFEVTPGTVIGLLTILGYSLYDTVVVFDGLKESTKDITKQTGFTYREAANRSLNGTLVRSINTSVVALLPVAGLLFIGGGVLGGGMLNDIALSLFVGLAAGAYSSIFIATPLVVDFKERDPAIQAHNKRVAARRASDARAAARGDKGPAGREDGPGAADAADGEPEDDPRAPEPAGQGVVGSPSGEGRRQQPVSRQRGRGRPSGSRGGRSGGKRR